MRGWKLEEEEKQRTDYQSSEKKNRGPSQRLLLPLLPTLSKQHSNTTQTISSGGEEGKESLSEVFEPKQPFTSKVTRENKKKKRKEKGKKYEMKKKGKRNRRWKQTDTKPIEEKQREKQQLEYICKNTNIETIYIICYCLLNQLLALFPPSRILDDDPRIFSRIRDDVAVGVRSTWSRNERV